MYCKNDLIEACTNARYPIDLSELTFKVAWSDTSNQPVFIFDQIDCYYTERGFSYGSEYVSKYVDIGCIPDGRQRMFHDLLDRFNRTFDTDFTL